MRIRPALKGQNPLALARWCAQSSASTTARSLRAVRSWVTGPNGLTQATLLTQTRAPSGERLREFVLLKPREAVREATGGLTRGYDPRLSVAGNRLARRLATLLEGLARMENWLRHSGRAELSQRDGELLRGGLERLGRDGQTVAQLSAQLAKELS